MNLDDLIPLLIFIGIIVFNIFKSLTKKKQGLQAEQPVDQAYDQSGGKAAPEKPSGLSKLLGTIKAEIEKARLEANPQDNNKTASIWKTLSGEDDRKTNPEETGLDIEDIEDVVQQREAESLRHSEIKKEVLEPVPAYEEKKRFSKQDSIADIISSDKQRKRKNKLFLSVSKMREAVVLSEIISKPIGLRDLKE